jgi:subtilisin family serine protease
VIRAAGILMAAVIAAGFLTSVSEAAPGRMSVGLDPGADAGEVGAAAEAATGGTISTGLAPLRALILAVPDLAEAAPRVEGLPGVAYVEPVTASRALAFQPTDPLAADQWYLPRIRAFDYWTVPPTLPPVRVAIIDSGIDGGHPEFAGRIGSTKSFVGSPARVDSFGHGTTVAGEIAAALNGAGIAGLGLPVELLIAKVVRRDGSISIEAEARAIRWAVDNGARVINLSLGGPRDPRRPAFDTYSELERSAIDYATRRGVVVVAAAGNCFYRCPEPYANYPAALPHVIGVGATSRSDRVPRFSNRDAVHVDLVAPGVGILSTYPRSLSVPSCDGVGYTRCAVNVLARQPTGTSFSAPLVAAAAALVFSEGSVATLHASQVTRLVEGSGRDVGQPGRDRASGWGLLDVLHSLSRLGTALPARDRLEPNDGTGDRAVTIRRARRAIDATVTRYEDPLDVYRIRLARRELLRLRLSGPAAKWARLILWRPGTPEVGATGKWRAASTRSGAAQRLRFRASRGGWYYAAVRGRGGAYRLTVGRG